MQWRFGSFRALAVGIHHALFGLPTHPRGVGARMLALLLGLMALPATASATTFDPFMKLYPCSLSQSALGGKIPLILIHGLGNDTPQTAEAQWASFANAFCSDPDLPGRYQLYTYGYDSSLRDSTSEWYLFDMGGFLRDRIAACQADGCSSTPWGQRPVVMIGHSMGGLVARTFMQRHYLNGVQGGQSVLRLITLATPHHGTSVANHTLADLLNKGALRWDLFRNNPDQCALKLLGAAGIVCLAFEPPNKGLRCINNYSRMGRFDADSCPTAAEFDRDGFYDKIIAYGGTTPSAPGDLALTQGMLELDGFPYNDGVVPIESALFDDWPILARHRSDGSCDHYSIQEASPGNFDCEVDGRPMFESLRADLLRVAPVEVSLTPTPWTGAAPLPVSLKATLGGAVDTVNYSFWWDCASTTTSVSAANASCGALPVTSGGRCETNAYGTKCDGLLDREKTVPLTYTAARTYTAKVIVEHGSTAVQAQVQIPVFTGGGTAPTLSGFTPGNGPVGTAVTINGSNLGGATSVRFNGTGATIQWSAAGSVLATVPAGASSGPISVTTGAGTASSASGFTVTQPGGGETCAQASGLQAPVDNAANWWHSGNPFGNYLSTWGGHHPGEDWNRSNPDDTGQPVRAIAPGIVRKIHNMGAGRAYAIAVEHSGTFSIPAGSATLTSASGTQSYSYPAETVSRLYSVYLHIDDPAAQGVSEGACVEGGQILGRVAEIGGNHLHFEIRHGSAFNSTTYTMVYDSASGGCGNWAGGCSAPTGYYLNLQGMVNSGQRNPSDVLAANPLGGSGGAVRVLTGDRNGDGLDRMWTVRALGGQLQWTIPSDDSNEAPILYGNATDLPVVGDFNGDGRDDMGILDAGATPSTFYLDTDRNAVPDCVLPLAGHFPQDVPIAGDWDGDGDDDIGAWNVGNLTFYLFEIACPGSPGSWVNHGSPFTVPGATANDVPLTGDWNGDGAHEVGLFRSGDPNGNTNNFYFRKADGTVVPLTSLSGPHTGGYGMTGDLPAIGDWNGDSYDTIGVYRPSSSTRYIDDNYPKFLGTPTLTITFPNGGQSWTGGSQRTLTWTASNLPSGATIGVWINWFSNQWSKVGDYPAGQTSTVALLPNLTTSDARVYIDVYNGGTYVTSDWSDAPFSITAAVVQTATVAFTSPSSSVSEGGVSTPITARILTSDGAPLVSGVSVGVASASGSATTGSDFTSLSTSFYFAAGTASGGTQQLWIAITPDTLAEPSETFYLTLFNPVGASLGAQSSHTVTILDDDGGPVNDSFANRIQVTGISWTRAGTNVGATLETGEPNHAGVPQGASVWWRWTATRSGPVRITTQGSSFDTVLAIYTGASVGALTAVTYNDDTAGRESDVQFFASAGTDYAIAVSGYSAGTGSIALAMIPATGRDDFGGDGRSDLLWRQTGGALYLWQMRGATVTASSYVPPISTAWQVKAIGDFGGDGRSDILWRENASGATYVWTMNGATVTAAAYTASQADNSWTIQGLGDFGGDGKADILWRHSGGALYVWQMNGTSLGSSSYLPPISLAWTIKGIGDFDGDGKTDILWRESASGATYMWMMNGAVTTSAGYTTSQADNSWTIQGVGDFDRDGRSDILWRHSGGALYVWLMNGTSVASSTYLSPISTAWQIQQLSDFNGDGRTDILWRETPSGATYVWFMNGATTISAAYTGRQTDTSWAIQRP